MTSSTINDMKSYDELLVGSYYERITQNIDVLNEASAGTLRMVTDFVQGDFEKESFFKNFNGLSRRDDTSLSDANSVGISQDEDITVKLKRKFLVEATRDQFRSLGYSMEKFAQLCGEQMADETKQEALERLIASLDAALSAANTNNLNVSGDGNGGGITHLNVNKMLALMGDRSSGIKAFVMSGACFHAWAGNMLSGVAPQFNDSGISVYNGGVPTLSRPVIVTDSPTLTGANTYTILGLQEGAGEVKISEDPDVVFADVTGKENLIKRCQGEGAYNLSLRGHKWNIAGGGRNPSNAAVATASNWTRNVASHKDLPGTRLVVSQ
ncbi:major capsid protein [Tardiphaga sp.]|uniref:major capsid protein n=1 Tax=Tardiphaga sp. TaxID=1926292 RepID=UPI0037DA545F